MSKNSSTTTTLVVKGPTPANTSQPSKPKKKKKNKGKGPKGPAPKSSVHDAVCEAACALVDPWHSMACNARIPDMSSTGSLTAAVRMMVPISTNADGDALYWFQPVLNAIGVQATLVAGVVTAQNSLASVPYYADYQANCTSYRPVSFGVKYLTTQAWTNAIGIAIVTDSQTTAISSVGMYANSMNMSKINEMLALRDCSVSWVGRPVSNQWANFIGITTAAHSFSVPILAITGATPNSVVGYAEVMFNVEFTIKPNTIAGLFPGPTAKSNPTLLALANAAQNDIDPIMKGSGLAQSIKDAVASAAREFGPQLMQAAFEAMLP